MSVVENHLEKAKKLNLKVRVAVVTISSSKTESTDISGGYIKSVISEMDNHRVVDYKIVPDNPTEIRATVMNFINSDNIDVIITTGGTGISQFDFTPETIEPLLNKKLEGFGELFRMLSYQSVGSASILSRAFAGVTKNNKIIFCLPGSPHAVKLAFEKLILPQLQHMLYELLHK